MEDKASLTVDASPTKEFFVDTITRDIPLDRAISDLVDNCVDGAKRIRDDGVQPIGEGSNRYDGLYVDITITPDEFIIADNCGGIDLDTARHYAFKFGRSKGFKRTANSVGQFGVGMKRAVFKMGDSFEVQSADQNHSFRIEVDVPAWLQADGWDFEIKNLVEFADNKNETTGTTLRCWNLHDGVSDIFKQSYFLNNVRRHILTSQQHFMRHGLRISINKETLIPNEWQLQRGSGIEPSFQKFSDQIGEGPAIKTRIYAGVGPTSQARAGWYIFCNGRCILEADQSETTGWGELSGPEGINIPRYHGQFARFRGYAFLDCELSDKLPWNTTKTDLDLEDPAYRLLKGRLIIASRPVIDFLNELDRESDFEVSDRDLATSLANSAPISIGQLPERAQFTYTQTVKRGPPLKSISFKKPEEEINALKERLDVTNNRDVGIKSFEYAYQRLVAEDDL